MSFYKTNNPAVLLAEDKLDKEKELLVQEAKAFAELFGAKQVLYNKSMDFSFGGLCFSPAQDLKLWTNPDRKHGHQKPRVKVTKLTDEEKQQHKKLLEDWQNNYPNRSVRNDEFYSSFGKEVGSFFFSSLMWFAWDGFVYLKTEVALSQPMIEILGSEFNTAHKALKNASTAT